jgi:hypothetical protein
METTEYTEQYQEYDLLWLPIQSVGKTRKEKLAFVPVISMYSVIQLRFLD